MSPNKNRRPGFDPKRRNDFQSTAQYLARSYAFLKAAIAVPNKGFGDGNNTRQRHAGRA